jgi:hypothetical protein
MVFGEVGIPIPTKNIDGLGSPSSQKKSLISQGLSYLIPSLGVYQP